MCRGLSTKHGFSPSLPEWSCNQASLCGCMLYAGQPAGQPAGGGEEPAGVLPASLPACRDHCTVSRRHCSTVWALKVTLPVSEAALLCHSVGLDPTAIKGEFISLHSGVHHYHWPWSTCLSNPTGLPREISHVGIGQGLPYYIVASHLRRVFANMMA